MGGKRLVFTSKVILGRNTVCQITSKGQIHYSFMTYITSCFSPFWGWGAAKRLSFFSSSSSLGWGWWGPFVTRLKMT